MDFTMVHSYTLCGAYVVLWLVVTTTRRMVSKGPDVLFENTYGLDEQKSHWMNKE
jgi:hypothetical protein